MPRSAKDAFLLKRAWLQAGRRKYGYLLEFLQANGTVVGDGAMGTMLQNGGPDNGGSPEQWNVDAARTW